MVIPVNSRQAWEDPNLTIAILSEVERPDGKHAEVRISDVYGTYRLTVPVKLKGSELFDFIEMANPLDVVFLNEYNHLVAWSGLSPRNGTLTQVRGVDVYE